MPKSALPSFSVVIEWDNARFAEIARAREMLRRLAGQIAALRHWVPKNPQVIVAFDPREVRFDALERLVNEDLSRSAQIVELEFLPARGLRYYALKNAGAERCRNEVIVFVDSDVIPEDDWLVRLLEPLRDIEVPMIAGNTYVPPDNLYRKAFALFWYFPLRAARDRFQRSDIFHANNVAFRRKFFLKHKFPDLPLMRSQCVALAESLRNFEVAILRREGARVTHPPPNGPWQFVCEALSDGHDWAMRERPATAEHANPQGVYHWRLQQAVREAWQRIRNDYRRVRLRPGGALAAMAIAVTYSFIVWFGKMIATRNPEIIRRHFAR